MDQFVAPPRAGSNFPPAQRSERGFVWESLRDRFTQLYSIENKSLPEVMRMLEMEHGFVASERQYKIKISEWHLEKNIKDEEVRFIAQTQLKRAFEDKETQFRVRGRDVDPEKIARAVKRKKISDDELLAMPSAPTPSDISYGTPSAVDPRSPYAQQTVAQSSGLAFDTSIGQALVQSPLNPSEWQNQAAFLTSPGYIAQTPLPTWYGPSTPLLPASYQTPPGMLQSPGTLWNTGVMEKVVEEVNIETLMDDSDVCEVKFKRLVALVRKTEEKQLFDYMGTMLDVNILVYDLITSDQSRSQLSFKDKSTAVSMCYVCKALAEIGTNGMADKVESERILLEAIAVSEGCFGEKHPAAIHYRVKLCLLYKDWGCRTGYLGGLLVQIMVLASRVLPAVKSSDLMDELLPQDLADDGQCICLQDSSWNPFASTSSRQFSALSIRDDATWDSPGKIWGIISAVVARWGRIDSENCDGFEPLFEMILKHGPNSVDGSSYFWMTTFALVVHKMWGAIQNSKDLISNAASELFPGSTAIKLSLEGLVYRHGYYDLEKRPVAVGNDESCLEIGDSSSLGPHQSKFDDLSKLKGPLENLTELSLVLAEISIGQLANAELSSVWTNQLSAYDILVLLHNAAKLGNSTIIPKLKARLGDFRFDNGASFMNLLNRDGPVSNCDVAAPLEVAVRGGHCPTVEALLDVGADPDSVGISYPLIEIAAESGNFEIMRLLIKRGAVGYSPASDVCILRLLIELSDKSLYVEWLNNVLDDDNLFSLLSYTGSFGELEVYECLDIVSERAREQLNSLRNNTPRSGEPFLRAALTEGDRNNLQGFLDELEDEETGRGLELILDVFTGVHVEQQARGILRTALLGSTEEMNGILDPSEISELPTLHSLVSRNAPNALSVFLELGPNLAALDTEGNTALHVAARWNRVTCARQLLRFGIKVYTENKNGKTAYQIASEKGYKEFREEIEPFLPDLHFDLPRASLHSQRSF